MSPPIQRPLFNANALNYCPSEPPVLECLPAEPELNLSLPLETHDPPPIRFPRIFEDLARQRPQPDSQPLGLFAFGLLGFLTLGISGCTSDQGPPRPGPIRRSVNVIFANTESINLQPQHDLIGIPESGYLFHLRSLHFRPEMSEELDYVVSQYQFRMLLALEILRPEHIFMEELSEDLRGSEILSFAETIFPPSDWNQILGSLLTAEELQEVLPSRDQLAALLYMGAGLIYGLRHSDSVILHRTHGPGDAEVHARIDDCLALGGTDSECNLGQETYIFDQREATATSIMASFFRRNSGAEAVLIYGAEHQFCDDFRSQDLPISIDSLWLHAAWMGDVVPQPCYYDGDPRAKIFREKA